MTIISRNKTFTNRSWFEESAKIFLAESLIIERMILRWNNKTFPHIFLIHRRETNRFETGWIWDLRKSEFDLTRTVNLLRRFNLESETYALLLKKKKNRKKKRNDVERSKGGNWSERDCEKNLATCSVLATERREENWRATGRKRENTSRASRKVDRWRFFTHLARRASICIKLIGSPYWLLFFKSNRDEKREREKERTERERKREEGYARRNERTNERTNERSLPLPNPFLLRQAGGRE